MINLVYNLHQRLECMVNDVTLSMETQADFKTYLDDYSNMHPRIELTVTVLTNGVWPTCKSSELNLPSH